jgi:LPS export ABC transporter protein LptC
MLAAVLGCGRVDTTSEAPPATSGVEREIRGFSLSETQGGKTVWQLEARVAWRIPRETRVHLDDVELTFYDETEAVDSHLTALRGVVDETSGAMTASGKVKLISADGDTLTTEELSYDKAKDRVSGPGFVRITKPDRVLTGWEFDAKPDLSEYEIRRDVSITLVERGNALAP